MIDNTYFFFQIFSLSRKSTILDNLMIFGAEYLIYFVLLLLLSLVSLKREKERGAALMALISVFLTLLIIKIIRLFIFEPRPFVTFPINPLTEHSPDPSFPSLHAAVVATTATSFALFKSKLAPFFIFSLIWVGFARVYVGVHYPWDILGGVLVGFFSTFLIFTAKDWLSQKISKWADKILSF